MLVDKVIYDISSRNEDVLHVLTTIQLSPSPIECGKPSFRFEGCRKEVKEFKAVVNAGVNDTSKLLQNFPLVRLRFPLAVFQHANQMKLKESDSETVRTNATSDSETNLYLSLIWKDAVHRTKNKKMAFHPLRLHRP